MRDWKKCEGVRVGGGNVGQFWGEELGGSGSGTVRVTRDTPSKEARAIWLVVSHSSFTCDYNTSN